MRPFWSFLEPLKSSAKFLKIQSALPRSGSLLWLVSFQFSLKTAGVRGAGTRDEPLRTSVWEATLYPSWINVRVFTFFGGKFWYKVNWKAAVCYYMTVWFSFFSHPGCATLLKSRIINREVVFLYIDDPNDRFLKPAVIRKRNVAMNIYERSQMAITWLSYVVILCKLYLHNILPSLLSDFLRVRVRVRVIVGLIFVNPTIVLTETIYCFCFFFPRYLKFGAHTSWYTS